ncbi:expressed unknown protein [Seminavis robusta]|uniref:EF-hand domain-containing protein n=1 Tax=Seminavis robusta TaxID=568900 RepID=A0A9N8D4W2_9STRA|nr:expressed unknown protein [Seminavis robusta]|eukprot:Sro5_g004320.1 n/a (223) ;mRNA; r:123928-124596
MIRSLTLFTMASSAMAFQVALPTKTPAMALQMSSEPFPYYASLADTSNTLVEEAANEIALSEEPAPKAEAPKPKTAAPKKKKGPVHKEGVLSPMVMFVRGFLGDELLNKVRGKAISIHSGVIGNFVETSDSVFGDAVLRSLFHLADKDGNGTICEAELQEAMQSLGFDWLQAKQVAGIFKRADADESGTIDMDEWVKEAPKTLRTNLVKLAKKNGNDMGLLS